MIYLLIPYFAFGFFLLGQGSDEIKPKGLRHGIIGTLYMSLGYVCLGPFLNLIYTIVPTWKWFTNVSQIWFYWNWHVTGKLKKPTFTHKRNMLNYVAHWSRIDKKGLVARHSLWIAKKYYGIEPKKY